MEKSYHFSTTSANFIDFYKNIFTQVSSLFLFMNEKE